MKIHYHYLLTLTIVVGQTILARNSARLNLNVPRIKFPDIYLPSIHFDFSKNKTHQHQYVNATDEPRQILVRDIMQQRIQSRYEDEDKESENSSDIDEQMPVAAKMPMPIRYPITRPSTSINGNPYTAHPFSPYHHHSRFSFPTQQVTSQDEDKVFLQNIIKRYQSDLNHLLQESRYKSKNGAITLQSAFCSIFLFFSLFLM